MNFYTGLQEYDDMAFLLHTLRSEDLFVDVGANVGSYTLLAAGAVGARCVSLEPVPLAFGRLLENIRLNGLQPLVEAHQVAAGSKTGSIAFTSNLDATNHAVGDSQEISAAITVPVTTLDQLMGDRVPQVIKIDVEGYETHVIDGAQGLLRNHLLIAIIMESAGLSNRYHFDEGDLSARLLDCGFKPFTYNPRKRKLSQIARPKGQGNTIWIRDQAEIERRIRSAVEFRIGGRIRL